MVGIFQMANPRGLCGALERMCVPFLPWILILTECWKMKYFFSAVEVR